MADFLTTKQALAAIESVIDGARDLLTLVSPYQRLSPVFRARIEAAARRGVRIRIVYGPQEGGANEVRALATLPNTEVYFSAQLHAKCYANESAMIITSLNLLVSSEQNWEMGVRLDPSERAYEAAQREIDMILAHSQREGSWAPTREVVPREAAAVDAPRSSGEGHCIRCWTTIALNPTRPLCFDCYDVWRQWENWDYEESWCHACGEGDAPTSFAKPLCRKCFAAHRSPVATA